MVGNIKRCHMNKLSNLKIEVKTKRVYQVDNQGFRPSEISKLIWSTPVLNPLSSELVISSKPRFRFQEAALATIIAYYV